MKTSHATLRPDYSSAPFRSATGYYRDNAWTASIANASIAVAVLLSGFVRFEPAPFDLYFCMLLAFWALAGLRIPASVLPLLMIFTVFNAGGIISSFQIEDWRRGVMYVAVSYFLALAAVFFACVIAADMGRLRLIFRSYVLAACFSTALGIAGYFGIGGFQIFTLAGRSSGGFQDPNVYAPFLAAPILYLIYGIVNRRAGLLLIRIAMLLFLLMGLFLAFSRGAWGLSVLVTALFYSLLILNEQRARIRLKYIAIAVCGIAAIILMIVAALQCPIIADMFTERAKVVQHYDGGQGGQRPLARCDLSSGLVDDPLLRSHQVGARSRQVDLVRGQLFLGLLELCLLVFDAGG